MDVFRRDREFDVSALQGRLSTSSQSQCSTDPGLIAGTWHRPLFLTRDRWFESTSLQPASQERTVRLPSTSVQKWDGLTPALASLLSGGGTPSAGSRGVKHRVEFGHLHHIPNHG